jgi:hypothetical protein
VYLAKPSETGCCVELLRSISPPFPNPPGFLRNPPYFSCQAAVRGPRGVRDQPEDREEGLLGVRLCSPPAGPARLPLPHRSEFTALVAHLPPAPDHSPGHARRDGHRRHRGTGVGELSLRLLKRRTTVDFILRKLCDIYLPLDDAS